LRAKGAVRPRREGVTFGLCSTEWVGDGNKEHLKGEVSEGRKTGRESRIEESELTESELHDLTILLLLMPLHSRNWYPHSPRD